MDNIYIRLGNRLYRQIVGISMGTNCAPLVADLFSFCYEGDFMTNLSVDNKADVLRRLPQSVGEIKKPMYSVGGKIWIEPLEVYYIDSPV